MAKPVSDVHYCIEGLFPGIILIGNSTETGMLEMIFCWVFRGYNPRRASFRVRIPRG